MKCHWTNDEFETEWRGWPDEEPLFKDKSGATQLGFLLKFFKHEARFPSNPKEVHPADLVCMAGRTGVDPGTWADYPLEGRPIEYHRAGTFEHVDSIFFRDPKRAALKILGGP